jgi:phage-related protein
MPEMPDLRPISWLKAAEREFLTFPRDVQLDMRAALTIAARGGKADTAKPFKGVGGGVFEIALKHRGDCFPRHLCRADRRSLMGGGRVSEEVQERDQDAASGCRSHQRQN